MAWPRAILLDFYGTVVEEDYEPIARICEQIAGASTVGATPGEIGEAWGRRFAELCAESHGPRFRLQIELELQSLRELLDQFQAPLDAEALSEWLHEYWRRPSMTPESADVLERCALPVCLVSAVDNADLASALEHTGLAFDHIVTSEDCRAYKPHPAPFERALEALGLAAVDVLHVGDSLRSDVAGAKALGIPVLWINRQGRTPPDGPTRPDYVARDLTGLLDVIAG